MPASRLFSLTPCVALFAMPVALQAADTSAGKAKVEQACAECHRASDWSGETTAALESLLKDIIAGRVQHRKRELHLTEQDAANIAAYWTAGRKKN